MQSIIVRISEMNRKNNTLIVHPMSSKQLFPQNSITSSLLLYSSLTLIDGFMSLIFFFLLAFDGKIKVKFWEEIVMSQGKEAKIPAMRMCNLFTFRPYILMIYSDAWFFCCVWHSCTRKMHYAKKIKWTKYLQNSSFYDHFLILRWNWRPSWKCQRNCYLGSL